MNILGLDVGTTTIKGQILNQYGDVLAYEEEATPVLEKDKISYISPQSLQKSTFKVIRSLAKQVNGEINVMCFSSFGEAFTLIDNQGQTICDFILFISSIGNEEIDQLDKKISRQKIQSIAGVNPNRMFSISKLLYIKNHQPNLYKRAQKLLLVAPFIVYALTGVVQCDYTLASRTMCLDVKNKTWSKDIIEKANLNINLFPPLHECSEIVGQIKSDIARQLGINSNCIVLASGHDQLMAAIGSGINKQGMAADGTGTAECLTIAFKDIPTNESFYDSNYCIVPYIIPHTYITYAFTSTGGGLLKWFKDKLLPIENKAFITEGKDFYQEYSNKKINLPTSLLVLPHFDGTGTPYLDAESMGAIIGLTQSTTRGEIYFALMESTTFEIRLNISLLEKEGIHINEIIATGGGAKSDSWLQMKSDILNQKITTVVQSETGIYGCYILCMHALFPHLSFEELISNKQRQKCFYVPNSDLANLYSDKFVKYIKMYPLIKQLKGDK